MAGDVLDQLADHFASVAAELREKTRQAGLLNNPT
jgi:hypothetical protein